MKEKEATRSDSRNDDSWANETLPMGVRRELLDRELRRVSAGYGAARSRAAEAAVHPQHSERPQDG